MYFRKKSSSKIETGSGVTTFYTGETDDSNTIQQSGSDCCFLTSSGETTNVKSSIGGQSSKSFKSMPKSVKSTEEQLTILAAFMASCESYIQGKIVDPTISEEDYDQINLDDLAEMDLKWQLAMISRRANVGFRHKHQTLNKRSGRSIKIHIKHFVKTVQGTLVKNQKSYKRFGISYPCSIVVGLDST